MSYLPRRDGYAARVVDMIALLIKRPRSAAELRKLCGYSDIRATDMYLQLLREEGLIYVQDWILGYRNRSKPRAIYAWQPSVSHLGDAPQPEIARRAPLRHNGASIQPLTRSPAH